MTEKIHGETMFASYGVITSPDMHRGDSRTAAEIGLDFSMVGAKPMVKLSDPACAGKDSTLWIDPQSPTSLEMALRYNREALDVCRSCGVRLGCLEWALEQAESGLWGGILQPEREAAIEAHTAAEALIARDVLRTAAPKQTSIIQASHVRRAQQRRLAAQNRPG